MLEVLSHGGLNSVQDAGRQGLLADGIASGGAMDALALRLGNLLLGNDPRMAAIEVVIFPFKLRVTADTWLAVAGADADATLDKRAIGPLWAFQAKAGQVLTLRPPRRGSRAYVCVAGGVDVPIVLGARATDLKTGFGGHQGRGLAPGDILRTGQPPAGGPCDQGLSLALDLPERGALIDIRVLPGGEWDAFTAQAQAAFTREPWRVTQDSNRMGMRLEGERLDLKNTLEMMSHGILPGTVQVPPAGQPIIQLVEANTCGGYPKIAHVVDADLWLLAQAPIGAALRFVPVDLAAQRAAVAEQEGWIDGISQALTQHYRCE